jgi:CRP/FNR family transcriptional regulator, cyclic AMP receptor protein
VQLVLRSCSVLSLLAGASVGANRFDGVSLLLIEEGLVLVSASNRESARRIVLSLAGPGAVVLPPDTDENLEALTDARATVVSPSSKLRLLEIPAAAVSIVDGIRAALQDCRESLAHFASRRHADRVRLKLIQLASSHGKVGTNGLLLDVPLTHELLADMVGSRRETVTRALAQLEHEGIIQHERGRYRLDISPEELGS